MSGENARKFPLNPRFRRLQKAGISQNYDQSRSYTDWRGECFQGKSRSIQRSHDNIRLATAEASFHISFGRFSCSFFRLFGFLDV